MSRKQRYQPYDIRTSLAADDLKRFHEMSTARGIKAADLARIAIVFYLEHVNTPQGELMEARYVQAVKQAANRICAMLSKVAIDTRAIYRYLGELEGDPQRMLDCRNLAVQQITRVLTDSERRMADSISQAAMMKPSNPEAQNADDHQA
jgi:hypothetical protein